MLIYLIETMISYLQLTLLSHYYITTYLLLFSFLYVDLVVQQTIHCPFYSASDISYTCQVKYMSLTEADKHVYHMCWYRMSITCEDTYIGIFSNHSNKSGPSFGIKLWSRIQNDNFCRDILGGGGHFLVANHLKHPQGGFNSFTESIGKVL